MLYLLRNPERTEQTGSPGPEREWGSPVLPPVLNYAKERLRQVLQIGF